MYVDGHWNQHARATVVVHQDTKSAKITYYGDNGERFRVIVHTKPNPIGFHARLPGDARR
jgi:hypothetical protein